MHTLLDIFSRFTSLDLQAKEAATQNNRREAEALRKQGARLEAIAFGVGLAGNWDYADFLRNQNPQCEALTEALTLGFALGGRPHFAQKMKFENNVDPNVMALGLAIRGDKVAVQYLFQTGKVDPGIVAIGAILGGDVLWAEFIRKYQEHAFDRKFSDRTQMMSRVAARSGHTAYAQHLQGDDAQLSGPSDTAAYAKKTSLLGGKFYSSHHNDETHRSDHRTPFHLTPLETRKARVEYKPQQPATQKTSEPAPRKAGLFCHTHQADKSKERIQLDPIATTKTKNTRSRSTQTMWDVRPPLPSVKSDDSFTLSSSLEESFRI